MKLVRLYIRVLAALHREARLAWILAIANLALAGAQFAEPVLFGRVIDTLTGASPHSDCVWPRLVPFLALWVAFGLFTTLSRPLRGLYPARPAKQQRHCMLGDFFEHGSDGTL